MPGLTWRLTVLVVWKILLVVFGSLTKFDTGNIQWPDLAVFIWNSLRDHMTDTRCADAAELYEVKIWETDKNIVVYRGEDTSITNAVSD